MGLTKEQLREALKTKEFWRSAKYDPDWVLQNQMGPNALWLTEWLCQGLNLKPGMKVLDMGCGRAMSSVFLAKEFGVQVWATDFWVNPEDNLIRIQKAGFEGSVYPVQAEAHELPYENDFFDAIVCIDSYMYYGADDAYLSYFLKYAKKEAQIGIVIPGLVKSFDNGIPDYLTSAQKNNRIFLQEVGQAFHTVSWWRKLWEACGGAEIEVAEEMKNGWQLWLQWEKTLEKVFRSRYKSDAEALETDKGEYIGLIRMIARKK